jgi:hydrogenase expression/formation protein HypC
MCLGVPMQVTSLSEDNSAVVEFEGTRLEVRLDIVDQRPEVGDYVIVHAGYAIHWIDPEEAKITQELLKDVIAASEMSADELEGDLDDDDLDEEEDGEGGR